MTDPAAPADSRTPDAPADTRGLLTAALRDPELGPELRAAARRLVWWESPATAVLEGDSFVAAVMAEGSSDEIDAVSAVVGHEGLLAAFRAAPEHLFDPVRRRIWTLRLGLDAPRG